MVRPHDTGASGSLTEREREVLEMPARGVSAQEIGEHLRLSPDTVKGHTRSLFTKFDLQPDAALVIGRERGLI